MEESEEQLFDEESVGLCGKIYAAINFKGSMIPITLTPKQYEFIRKWFAYSGNAAAACRDTRVSPATAYKWMKNEKFRAYIEQAIQKIEDQKGKTVEDLTNELWAVWRGEKKKTSEQLYAASMIGKIQGAFKERMIHESYSRSELVFTTKKSDSPELESASIAGEDHQLRSQVHPSDLRQAVGQDVSRPLLVDPGVPETKLGSLVCSPAQTPSQGYGLAEAPGNTASGNPAP